MPSYLSSLQLYNTLSRQKESFQPITPEHVGIYFCGPTVYSEPHLGHARGPILFDVLKRWLEHIGYKVRLVSNITDVGHLTDDADEGEDKLLERAKLEQLEPMEIAEKYFWRYFDALHQLGVRRPDIVPKATGHIMEQINMTKALLAAGHAYEVNGSVYFEVSSWQDYGSLSGRKSEDALEGTRVNVRSEKRDPRDFALWKRAEDNHIMRWESPWGEGFPGWHIECSAMSTKYLGDHFDIHGGGIDLLFPHHECEIAQAKATGKSFANTWMHWNFITLEGEKMSKSKGHFKTLAELFTVYDPQVIRFNMLSSHYRSISDFSSEGLHASKQGLQRIKDVYAELQRHEAITLAEATTTEMQPFAERFAAALNDDLNTPQALAVLFDAVREVNSQLSSKADATYVAAAKAFFEHYAGEVLGVLNDKHAGSLEVNLENNQETMDVLVQMIAQQRQAARARRDFSSADAIRADLAQVGIFLEDTPEGVRWKKRA